MCKINYSVGCKGCSPEDHKRTPHKHAVLIKAYADGFPIQHLSGSTWHDITNPSFFPHHEYRIKPEQPDLEKYGVEGGDVWSLETVHVTIRCCWNGKWLTVGHGSVDIEANHKLLFRRGVVNRL